VNIFTLISGALINIIALVIVSFILYFLLGKLPSQKGSSSDPQSERINSDFEKALL